MATATFGTKAENLELLSTHFKNDSIKPLLTFTVQEWIEDQKEVISNVQKHFEGKVVIIRSSMRGEDSLTESHAGAFVSVANIHPQSTKKLSEGVEKVLGSYGLERKDDQFFVQEQVQDISISGVLFTRDIDTLAPYYIVNYDEQSGSHDTVTSGNGESLKTYIRYRGSKNKPRKNWLSNLFSSAQEIESLFGCDALDIEFAINKDEKLFILQVRPIVLEGKEQTINDEALDISLLRIHKKITKLNAPHPGLHGNNIVYSVMTDWNPAEIIGVKPHPLALSLYKELITDAIWAYQRHNYGYKDLRSFPLLISFLGCPYIDVRASFNSFVPEALGEELTSKLVDYYINSLVSSPTDHDKVEFNIIYSCYYLDLPEKINKLQKNNFSDLELDRIKFALLSLTNNVVSPSRGIYRKDLKRVKELETRMVDINTSDLYITDKIYWLIENCKRYGTLPFAGLARAGFIAVQFLQSFVSLQIITKEELSQYMSSLDTVASQLSRDFHSWKKGELSKEMLLRRYGHLRPGTYDLLSARYDEAFEMYFGKFVEAQNKNIQESFEFSVSQLAKIERALRDNGIEATAPELIAFIKEAIEGREYSKFVFTKALSEVLKLIENLGAKLGFTKEEISFVNIRTVIDLYSNLTPNDLREIFSSDIKRNKKDYEVTKALKLPQCIVSEDDIYDFYVGDVEPNYVTLGRVTKIVIIEDEFFKFKTDLTDKIVFIKSADPGYDWLFSRNIGGLVTMYGGANSHMAIRCAELKIPAVIGCGEKNFDSWSQAKILEIDCANRKVRAVEDAM